MINHSHCLPSHRPHFLFSVFVVSLSFLRLPSHSLFFISGIIASNWSCDSMAFVSSVIWLYDLQETEWVWCDGNNPDSLCDWAAICPRDALNERENPCVHIGGNASLSFNCSLDTLSLRLPTCLWMQLLCQCVCVFFSGWRSMAVAAFFFPLKIWSRNVSLTDYPQCLSPTQGPRLACRRECVCVCVSAGGEQCRGQIYSARGLDRFCRGLWVFLEGSSVRFHCCRCGTWLNYNCVLLLNRVTHNHTLATGRSKPTWIVKSKLAWFIFLMLVVDLIVNNIKKKKKQLTLGLIIRQCWPIAR